MPRRTDLKRVLVIGSGPIVIGQSSEFDYSGTQACKALKAEGLEVVLVNSNPATIMTDPEFADRTYVEPLTVEIAERIQPLGWHIVIYFEAQDLPDLYEFVASLPTIVVVDHMGRPEVTQPLNAPGFELFVKLMTHHEHIWSKVSGAERLSRRGPPEYEDFVPFARRIVETFPERVLWGTDWPHPNLKTHMPDDGQLVDLLPRIAPTQLLRKQLLVDNPMRLYWAK